MSKIESDNHDLSGEQIAKKSKLKGHENYLTDVRV